MAEVMFLPWLGLQHPEEVAGIKFVPKASYLSPGHLPPEELSWLNEYLSRYQRRDGGPSQCVVMPEEADASNRTRVIRATAAACLVHSHAEAFERGNATMGPVRAESWIWYVQRFDPSKRDVVVTEGYVTNVLQLDDFRELAPWEWVDGVYKLDDPVRKMAEALVREAENDQDFAAALELLVEGFMTSSRHVTRLNFILAGSALELLAEAGSGRAKADLIAEALVCAIKRARRGSPVATESLEREATAARQADPELVRVWMAGCKECDRSACKRHKVSYDPLYRRRNKVIHEGMAGGVLLRHQRPDTGELHLWQVGRPGSGAHATDVALTMAGWLLLDRVGSRLASGDWFSWCRKLDRATSALGMGLPLGTTI